MHLVSPNGEYVVRNPDLRTMMSSASRPRNIAENFAIAEFVLMNDLSDNITLGIPRMTGMKPIVNGSTPLGSFTYDEHYVGSFITLLGNTYLNLCFGGCLLELFDRLKEKKIFNDILVDFSGEMGRVPRGDQLGSDHEGRALDVAMWSGALDSTPKVIGNVRGSYGIGAANDNYGIIGLSNLAATQAQILGLPNPIRSAKSLVKEQGGVLTAALPMGRLK